jgi:protein-tyrosine kinase
VSRIDEALRRARALDAGPAPEPEQTPFVPSWSVDSAAPDLHAVPATPSAAIPVGSPMLTAVDGPGLPRLNRRFEERLVSSSRCDSAMVEQYRRLAGTLHTAQQTSGLRLILVTSAMPGDGKTLTAVNLASVLADSYKRRVLLVDADLRRPSIGEVFDVSGSVGLSAALKATTDQKLAVIPLTENLTLLPAGQPDPDPLGGLTSPRMKRILDEAVEQFDWVILDGPPTGPLAETNLLAQMVQGTILVIRAGQTQHPAIQRAVDGLGRDRILGVVLNGVTNLPKDHYTYYGRENAAPGT